MIAYELSHPQLSQPLVMEAPVERTEAGLIAWATMFILQRYDVLVEKGWWSVKVLD